MYILFLQGSIRMYLKFYLCLHIISLITIFVLPKFIRGERRPYPPQSSSKTSLGGKENKPLIQNVIQNSDETTLAGNTTAIKTANKTASTQVQKDDLSEFNKQHEPVLTTPKLPLVNPGREAVSVPHDQCEMDQLSSKIMEKIEAETKNIEEFIDKTVTETVSGIVEFKNDLMRECEIPNGLRKRTTLATTVGDVVAGATGKTSADESAAFLKKEIEVINAVVQQANVLPAVLSNGHAK